MTVKIRSSFTTLLFIISLITPLLVGCKSTSVTANNAVPTNTPPPATTVPTTAPTAASTLTSTPAATTTPLPTATATPVGCTETAGRIEKHQLETDQLPYPLDFRVYIPPCFDPNADPGYPVLIMIHGQSYNDDQWERLGIAKAADKIIAEKSSRPFLIVMPRENYFLQDMIESRFGDGVVKALLPWIDNSFPTCTERSCRAIGGLSRGATWAMHLGLTNWKIFGAIGAHSYPPLGLDFFNIPEMARNIPEGEWPNLYIDTGTLDINLKTTIDFEQRLVQFHIPHTFNFWIGKHDEEYWSAHVEDYLRWYTEPWRPAP